MMKRTRIVLLTDVTVFAAVLARLWPGSVEHHTRSLVASLPVLNISVDSVISAVVSVPSS